MVKVKNRLFYKYLHVNNLYRWAMLWKLQVNDFKWVEEISQFNEDFIKSYNDERDEGYSLKVDV